jgi:predicted nucleic acid-binding protein
VSRKDLKILLDTSFILPFLGFKTNEAVMRALPRLRGYELYYSDVSILEALWKIIKVVKREHVGIVLEGVRLVKRDLSYAKVDEKAVEIAVNMYIAGHRDLVDNILYGISLSQGVKFLTIDRELMDFVKKQGYPDTFIRLEELGVVGVG